MTKKEKELAGTQLATIDGGNRGLNIMQNIDTAWRFADAAFKSRMAPKSFTSTEQVFIALQMGAEVGLSPMQSLKNIAVIQGTPSIWGDAVAALIRRSPLCKSLKQPVFTGEGETRVCSIKAERINGDTAEGVFGYKDAKRAGLLSRDTYKTWPDRMYYHRALGYVAHELFPDCLMGLDIAEEAQDLAYVKAATATLVTGDDAPLASLDQAAELLDQDETNTVEAEFEPYSGSPSHATPEEIAEWEAEKAAAQGQKDVLFW
jgi:hypothetical protein